MGPLIVRSTACDISQDEPSSLSRGKSELKPFSFVAITQQKVNRQKTEQDILI